MGYSDAFQEDHTAVHHKGSLTHDALGGAVAFELAKAYENHCAANGKPSSHSKAKEVLAALTAAAATHLIETKGLDAWDDHKRKEIERKAHERVSETIIEEYN